MKAEPGMPTILDEIVDSKRSQLESQMSSMPLTSFRGQLQRSDRDFARALRTPRPAFILECKKASPSKGLIRADFDLTEIARIYCRHASAISVLTESDYFQGSIVNLGIVRQNVPQPILCKDFFVHPYQVYQARHFGADAVLLILAILDDATWQNLFEIARSLGMAVVTEVSNREEQQRAIALGAPIVGINNRDLRDMSINLETSRELAKDLDRETIVISESGYFSNLQVREMSDCVDGFLVGSSLMAERNLESAVKSLIYGENKVCGLTRKSDAIAASEAGAVYGGVIFAAGSPREVVVEDVDELFGDTGLKRVGVFQNHSVEQMANIAVQTHLHVIQLHGDELPRIIGDLRDQIGSEIEIWKALSVEQMAESGDLWFSAGANRLVVDNHSGEHRGGTGRSFDWSRLPAKDRNLVMVAGGIGPANVVPAMKLGCAGVDMNSALEDSPGIKSASKIDETFLKLRNYQTKITSQSNIPNIKSQNHGET